MKILLDYFFPISSIEPTPQASTAFLKQVLLVVPPVYEETGIDEIHECTTSEQVAVYTNNTDADQLFAAGMSRVFILPSITSNIAEALEGHESDFFTILFAGGDGYEFEEVGAVATPAVKASLKIQDILFEAVDAGVDGNSITINYNSGGTAGSEGVSVTDLAITVSLATGVSTAAQLKTAIDANVDAAALITCTVDEGDEGDPQVSFGSAVPLENGADAVAVEGGLDIGAFEGVVGVSSTDDELMTAQAAIKNRAAFHTNAENGAQNMCYAFGKLLSNALNWRNQQYIAMPLADDVETLGAANSLFDDKVSFVISDDEFSNRLALFACGGKAIVAPYIIKNLQVDLQSAALSYVSGNQPAYTKKQGALLEDELKKVVQSYIDREWIEAGTVEIKLEQDNFVASGYINVAEPKAMWRIFGEMRQSL